MFSKIILSKFQLFVTWMVDDNGQKCNLIQLPGLDYRVWKSN